MTSRAIWIDRAQAILDELRALLQPFGVAMASDLRVTSDAHPCPGYLHDERRIAFCPPVIESSVDRARWLFFSKMMGCADVDEAAEFYDVALPLIVCHEASHHVRMSLAIASPSHFVEEQACDRLAVAMVRAMPNHRASLAPLRDRCARMSMRLSAGFGDAPGASFVSDVSEVLVATSVIDRSSLAEIERLAARDDLPLSELLVLLPSVSSTRLVEANEARQAAQRHVDSHYTSNAAEYWHLGLTWIGSYLDRSSEGASTAAQALADSVQSNLLCHEDERRAGEVESALLTLLADPSHRSAAAEGMIELKGEAVLTSLVVLALEEDDVFEAIVRSWPSDRSWRTEAVTPLLAGAAQGAERAWMQLRLAARSGLPAPPIDVRLHSALLSTERIASSHDEVQIEEITSCDRTTFFEAWEAHQRSLDELPTAYLDALINTSLDTRTRRALLRIARRSSTASVQHLATLALIELGDPLGPRGDDEAANDDAHALLRRLDSAWVSALAQTMLPSRGGPAWREFLEVVDVSSWPPSDTHFTTERSLATRLRAAAAHADLSGYAPESDESCRDAAHDLIAHAEALRAHARTLFTDTTNSAMAALARDSILDRVKDLSLEVIRALVPSSRSDAIARLCDRLSDVNHDARLANTTRSLLIEATPAAFRDAVRRLLEPTFDTTQPIEAITLDLSLLPPLAVAALTQEESDMLTTIEKLVQLRGVPLFGGIALEHLRGLAALAVVESYEADTVVFSEGDPGDRLYLVLAGQIAIEKAASGATVTLDLLGPSSVFGEMSLFDGAPRSATARARTAVTLLTISSAAVARIGREEPRMYESFLRVLAVRLRAANVAVMGALNVAPRSSRG